MQPIPSIILLLFMFATTTTMAQKIKPNEQAPAFELVSAQGKTIDLADYNDKTVLLVFFRFAGCPVCNFQMHTLIENYSQLQKQNMEVIAVFESGNEMLASYINDAGIPFPVIGNPDLGLYKKYGVEKSAFKMMRTMFKKEPKRQMKQGEEMFNGKKYKQDGSMTRMPADFIIDRTGSVKVAHYGKYIGDHLPLNTILKAF
jgi:thioredoxin-dependent peroxiredoxin